MARAGRLDLIAIAACGALTAALPHAARWCSPLGVVALYAAIALGWCAIVWRTAHADSPPPRWWAIAIGAAIAARLIASMAEPVLSDDLYRYVWDGRVAAAGIDPYRFAPLDPALAALRDPHTWPHINHAHLPTIYPPLSQKVFWFNALLGGTERSMRWLFCLFELTALGAAWRLCVRLHPEWARRHGRLAWAIYALNPIVILESYWSGHVDVLAWSAMALALIVGARAPRRALMAGALIGASVALKLLGALALPLLWARASWSSRAAMSAGCAIVVAMSWAPHLGVERPTGSLGTYASSWRANDGPFRAIDALAHHALERGHPDAAPDRKLVVRFEQLDEPFVKLGWTRPWKGKQVPATSFGADQVAGAIAKLAGAGVVALALLWALIVVRTPTTGALLLFGCLFFVAPTVYPWYVCWLAPIAAIAPRRRLAAQVFMVASLCAYAAWVSESVGGAWRVPDGLVALEFGAVAAAAWWDRHRHRTTGADIWEM